MERAYPKFTVTEKAQRNIRGGHPWVYYTEITAASPCEDGELADVFSEKGKYLGTGFFNSHSKIRIRIFSRNANDRFDEAFFRRRLQHAVDYRRTVMGKDFSCCRLIFGEADLFPGWTVDRFGSILVSQTLSLGIEKRKGMLFPMLVSLLREYGEEIDGIYERNDVAIRELEGMEQGTGTYIMPHCPSPLSGTTEITENGIHYFVDYAHGQKTRFFLDQKYNRVAAGKIAPGKKVLDCFTHTGAFALNAAKAGAQHVCAVDISQDAVDMAARNAQANGLENCMSFRQANVFDLLTELSASGDKSFDYIILDPPAFTKSHSTVHNAIRGYKEINMKAMKLLPRGGYLATCSCSHFMTDDLFRKMLHDAAGDASVSLRQIEARQQSPDHPILWNVPETEYLKFYIFQVV